MAKTLWETVSLRFNEAREKGRAGGKMICQGGGPGDSKLGFRLSGGVSATRVR